MNIPLDVLVRAEAAMKMLREVADPLLTGPQYMEALRSWSLFQYHVKAIAEQVSVEVQS